MEDNTLHHIRNLMKDLNDSSWKVYFDQEYAWRFESTEKMMEFQKTDMGKALLIVTKAWCELHLLAQDLDKALSNN